MFGGMIMKAVEFRETKKLQLVNMSIPQPKEDEILVKVAYCGICGSDLHTYVKGLYVKSGQVMGHEFSGIVEEVGKSITGITAGARVVIKPLGDCGHCEHCLNERPHLCENVFSGGLIGYGGTPGAFAEYVVIPKAQVNKNVFVLPSEISLDEAALIEPLAVALRGIHLADIGLNETVVVFGAGPIGLCVAQVAKSIGSSHVIQVDLSDHRLETAKACGIDTVINPRNEDVLKCIAEITGKGNHNSGATADIVFECAGVPITVKQSLKSVRHGGTIISLALFEEELLFNPSTLVAKEVKWQGAFGYFSKEFQTAISLVKSKKVNLKGMISHTYPIDKVLEAFEKQLDSANSVKVCFHLDKS
jgi:2-desacetyl-2-hydroxyethyl bacteriochlorophyllide A dehydrogenase